MADPLHGITLETIVTNLVDAYGFPELAERIPIRCFAHEPSVMSSLKFLRRTPWARAKVEGFYLFHLREQRRIARRSHAGDLRGAAAVVVQATKSVTKVVEEMQSALSIVHSVPIVSDVSELVYGSIRGITALVGAGADVAVAALGPLLGESAPGPEREAVVAALNGVVGDHLEATDNALAIEMSLRPPLDGLHDGGTLLVLVHGSCANDLQWSRTLPLPSASAPPSAPPSVLPSSAERRSVHDHGRALARDLGFTPAYLQYNSGLHISTNGQRLSALLEIESAPFRDVVIVAHSMGGLVARAAIHAAEQQQEDGGSEWQKKLRALVTLGTPHHGAPLERGGNIFEQLLGKVPWSAPLAALGRMRSAGITDMRYGSIVDADWRDRDRFAHGPDPRSPVPLPEGVRCYAVAATRTAAGAEDVSVDDLAGDNIVPVKSALGVHDDIAFTLRFTDTHVLRDANHVDLLGSAEVYGRLVGWLAAAGAIGRG